MDLMCLRAPKQDDNTWFMWVLVVIDVHAEICDLLNRMNWVVAD